MKTEISLSDRRYFDVFIGERVLQSDIFEVKGTIPIYSTNVMTPFGYANETNITDFSHDHILWGIDGDFKFNIIPRGMKFATTDHCGAIRILDQKIIPEYLIFQLELQSHLLGYDRTLRPSLAKMHKLIVKVPIHKDGNLDAETQKSAIDKYKMLRDIKKEVESELNGLSLTSIRIPLPEESIGIRVRDLFDLSYPTNGSNFSKRFIAENKGNIPVYSTSKDPNEISYGHVADNLPKIKYYENILTWNKDGSAGKVFYREGRFAPSEKVVPLVLRKEWEGLVDCSYIKFMLEQEALALELAFSIKASKAKLKNMVINFPSKIFNSQKIPDISAQQQIAYEIENACTLKRDLVECLNELLNISIEI
jgi:restriction endonuclease S subunit